MPLTESQVKEITLDLRNESESVRLKACDVLAKLPAPDRASVSSVLPALTEIFLKDANPAVKFLAKKALQNLGQSPEKLKQAAEGAKSAPPVAEVDRAQMVKELPVLWKCATEELRPCVALLTKQIWNPDEHLRSQISAALEKCGHMLAAPPLLMAFDEEKKTPQWQAREREESDIFADARQVIDLMKLQASGINPALAAQMGNLQRPEVLAAFIDMLRSSNPVLRDNAVRILAELKDARTIDPLLRLLGAGQVDLDSKVITTLSKVARADRDLQIQILKKILSHFRPGEPDAKLFAIVEAVGRIANPKTFDFVKGCLRHPLARVRANAVEALQNYDVSTDDRVRLLTPLLRDENNRVRANTVIALWGTAAQADVGQQVEVMMVASDKWVRASLAFAMGIINASGVVPYLLRLLADPAEEVRRNAVKSIRRLSNREAVLALSREVGNENVDVRTYCIESIGRHGLSEHVAEVAKVAETPGQDLRLMATAILALGRLRASEHLGVITKNLRHETDRVRANAVEALDALNEAKVAPLLQGSILDPDPRTRANAIKALWKYGDLWVVDSVKTMLETGDTRFQASAAYTLGEMADMARNPARLVNLPLLMMALKRHPKFNDLKAQMS